MVEVRRQDGGQQQAQVPAVWEGMRGLEPFQMLRDLLRWDPFRDVGLLRGAIEPRMGFQPDFDVKETKDGYLIKADVPGVREKDLDVSVHGNRLQITGSRAAEKEEKTDTYFACERSVGSFTRVFTLPADIDPNEINAELKDGVLTVQLAKQPESQVKRIAIKGGVKTEKSK